MLGFIELFWNTKSNRANYWISEVYTSYIVLHVKGRGS